MPFDAHRTPRAALALTVAAVAALAACDGAGGVAPAGSGTIAVQLTDAPFPFDSVKSVDVYVVRIDARTADADSAESARNVGDDEKERGGWRTIAEPKARFDLLSLRGGKVANLGQQALPAGTYKAFRLVIDPAQSSVTLKTGLVLTGASDPGIKFPSAGQSGLKVQLDRDVRVGADSTARLLVDFDVGESFVMRGQAMRNGLLFKPTIRASVR